MIHCANENLVDSYAPILKIAYLVQSDPKTKNTPDYLNSSIKKVVNDGNISEMKYFGLDNNIFDKNPKNHYTKYLKGNAQRNGLNTMLDKK